MVHQVSAGIVEPRLAERIPSGGIVEIHCVRMTGVKVRKPRFLIAVTTVCATSLLLTACLGTASRRQYEFSVTSIAASPSDVWLGSQLGVNGVPGGLSGSIGVLEPSTGQLSKFISEPSDKISEPDAILVDRGKVWIANLNGGRGTGAGSITELNESTGDLVRVIDPRGSALDTPSALAVVGNNLWVADPIDSGYHGAGSLTEIDTSTGSVVRTVGGRDDQFNNPSFLAVAAGVLWVGNFTSVVDELNPASGSLIRVVTLPSATSNCGMGGMVASSDELWIVDAGCKPNPEGSLLEINARTGRSVHSVSSSAGRYGRHLGG